ncbi:nitrate reductase cytochrome c-type subunit [Paraferrimonas sedimenticola]|uniref:Periplasmic nitrate reductase, electron transfer subunit n=1 Tax=Paraferrimonas sedimenticola TaxID=375674 RepID=A0AA37RTH8_9GAMM|nr:nitrate reductase cytochrome c-type subunit [Paraferrimonas sedimenticola]GLP95535.1 periplasmic nitrate reductase, electron transfer subunit [Paraferrimonas sedimenticola]
MKKSLSVVAVALLLGACSGQMSEPQAEPVAVKSLHGPADISTVRPADAMPEYPKMGKSMERGFVHQPPLIPHKDYSITADKNSCLNCHGVSKKRPVHSSHIGADQQLDNKWYNCTQCHVPQASNKSEIVGNDF